MTSNEKYVGKLKRLLWC